ncbi:MAG: hypothetical protein CVU43_05665 [Chloroflexi bacterium HGW-Chloroflexi-5]|jgi:hypothetical protein|nr:MAG: hypothetical protein CVU43_05665 [Chloroflexi bacterium HGW-Chloroflexi-5]
MKNDIETEQDLQQLIGQYESIRLEFKASALLEQTTEQIIKQLTEEVSAFANTEGGVVIIGISEGKKVKKSIASEIDEGVDPDKFPPERLEQIIASNISPSIPGLTVRPIPLSGPKAGRVAYVVTVPKGTTAYQARYSLRYYGRSEFAAVPLHDNVIRLLMTRGRVPQIQVDIVNCKILTAEREWANRQGKLKAQLQTEEDMKNAGEFVVPRTDEKALADLEAPRRDYDQYIFRLALVNTGQVTIRDLVLSISITTSSECYQVASPKGEELKFRFDEGSTSKNTLTGGQYLPPEKKIFPGDRFFFPNEVWHIHVPAGTRIERRGILLRWTVYLDDAPPSMGEIDLVDCFEKSQ